MNNQRERFVQEGALLVFVISEVRSSVEWEVRIKGLRR